MSGITGKKALVTGGASGIGLAIANKLLENGATVYILDKSKEKLDKAVLESGNKFIPLQCDVSDWSGIRNVVNNVLPIQLLVNNAAIVCKEAALEITEAAVDTTFAVNVKGPINLTQFVANDLITRNLPGRVVNISTMLSGRAIPNNLVYCSSKAALDMATKCFALELGPKNIRVNAVNPTYVPTELTKSLLKNKEFVSSILSRTPLQRFATAEEVANTTLFLLSDSSEMITGHCLWIDGGYATT